MDSAFATFSGAKRRRTFAPLFVWRKVRHRIVKADGPERILGEWWRSDAEVGLQRDYYRVENAQGERFWLFRDAPAADGGRWWLHGVGEA